MVIVIISDKQCKGLVVDMFPRKEARIGSPELTAEVKSPNVVTVLRGFPLCFSLSETDIKVVLGEHDRTKTGESRLLDMAVKRYVPILMGFPQDIFSLS